MHIDWPRGHVAMDEHGFVLTGRDLKDRQLVTYREESFFFLEMSRPGVFAVAP